MKHTSALEQVLRKYYQTEKRYEAHKCSFKIPYMPAMPARWLRGIRKPDKPESHQDILKNQNVLSDIQTN